MYQYMLRNSSDVYQGRCKRPLVTYALPILVEELNVAWGYQLL